MYTIIPAAVVEYKILKATGCFPRQLLHGNG
jgi:hypothetical protein